MPSGSSSDRQADITSRKKKVMFSGQRAGLASCRRRNTCASRSGAIDVAGFAVFGLDLADLLRNGARWLRSRSNSPSIWSISARTPDNAFAQIVLRLVAHRHYPLRLAKSFMKSTSAARRQRHGVVDRCACRPPTCALQRSRPAALDSARKLGIEFGLASTKGTFIRERQSGSTGLVETAGLVDAFVKDAFRR